MSDLIVETVNEFINLIIVFFTNFLPAYWMYASLVFMGMLVFVIFLGIRRIQQSGTV